MDVRPLMGVTALGLAPLTNALALHPYTPTELLAQRQATVHIQKWTINHTKRLYE